MNIYHRLKLPGFILCLAPFMLGAAEQEEPLEAQIAQTPFNIIYTDNTGRYVYVSDFLGNHIMDYSHAGYMGGDEPVPSINGLPVFPVPNSSDPACDNTSDYTACIQNAINAAGSNYATTGNLSVVELAAGTYPIIVPATYGASLLTMPMSGVVLAGAGSGNTIITVTGSAPIPKGTELAVIGAGGNNPTTLLWSAPTAPRAQIANTYVPAGSTEFRVTPASSNGYTPQVGDNIIIDVPTGNYWSSFTNFGGIGSGAKLPPNTSAPWWGQGTVGPINSTYDLTYDTSLLPDVRYNRTVTAVVSLGNNTYGVSVDAPIFAAINNGNASPVNIALDAAPYIYPFDATASGYQNNIGIQNLSIDIGFYSGTADYNVLQEYATQGINFTQANDVWVDDVIISGYRMFGITTSSLNHATISNTDVVNQNTYFANGAAFGGGFAFITQNGSSNVLFNNCSAIMPNHGFAMNSTSTSGIVILNSSTTNNYLESGGHNKWSQGMLFDHLSVTNDLGKWASVALNNSFIGGTNHGWSAVNSMMWGVDLDQTGIAVLQQPPQGQNYFMSYTKNLPATATVTGQGLCNGSPCTQPSGNPGYFETNNTLDNTALPSLYQSQLAERQSAGGLPPSAPANLKVVFSSGKATLTWDTLMGPGQGVSGFNVERSVDGGKTFTLLNTSPLSATSISYADTSSGVSSNALYRIYALKNISNNNNTISARSPYSNLAPVVARYVKLVMYTSSNNLNGGNVQLKDFKVYSKSSLTTPVSAKTAYVYNYSNNNYKATTLPGKCYSNNVSCAFDSSTTTYFATAGSPWISAKPSTNQQNLYIDLTGATNSVLGLSKISLTFGNPFSPEYYIYVSSDGVNWTQVYGTIFGTTGLNTINF